jgi:hypothetical protein
MQLVEVARADFVAREIALVLELADDVVRGPLGDVDAGAMSRRRTPGSVAMHAGAARFKNQGDCVSFVATGGKNPPSGR